MVFVRMLYKHQVLSVDSFDTFDDALDYIKHQIPIYDFFTFCISRD